MKVKYIHGEPIRKDVRLQTRLVLKLDDLVCVVMQQDGAMCTIEKEFIL